MTARVGLIGHPLTHTISPRFQQAAFDTLGIDARYAAWDIEPEEVPLVIAGLRLPDALGANVTIPYKESALRSMDRLHETVRFVGALNTIVNRHGALEGYNTDVTGFQRALAEAGFDPKGATVVLWGAGGGARAVAWALLWREVRALTIINRTAARAGRLRHDLSAHPGNVRLRAYGADDPLAHAALGDCDLVVQCTSVGLRGSNTAGQVPFNVQALRPHAMLFDLIASPPATPLVEAARASGRQAVGGLSMLVYQGAASFELWTGCEPPLATMFAAAQAALPERNAG